MEVSVRAKEELAKAGYDPKMGARPLARLIDQQIKKPLSQKVLFENFRMVEKVLVDWDEKKSEYTFAYS